MISYLCVALKFAGCADGKQPQASASKVTSIQRPASSFRLPASSIKHLPKIYGQRHLAAEREQAAGAEVAEEAQNASEETEIPSTAVVGYILLACDFDQRAIELRQLNPDLTHLTAHQLVLPIYLPGLLFSQLPPPSPFSSIHRAPVPDRNPATVRKEPWTRIV
jgi:hypothetical protein